MQQEFTRRGRPGVRRFCEGCGRSFVADTWDAKRGFGRFCTKSCGQRGRPKPPRGKADRVALFWQGFERSDDCWLWKGRVTNGYGVVVANVLAHRLSWELHRGPIPRGRYVCHNCPGGDNPLCVNPDHLFLGSHADNQRDMWKKRVVADVPMHRGDKLRASDVLAIRDAAAHGIMQRDLAAEYGVSSGMIAMIVTGKRWKHLLPSR